ncbi:hypothetical protein [Amycolatopsis sp. H20-H5]|uniref:hypothetical protein n=1 Tax=Amycolatopsis sp. H20-H5 TaxID=3046309 RepID=UPI002DB7A519|nr:hypothetical protein [Amycolatopsis sp. H20-H5]MEC3975073.1 hypothetical protein [Amycolatopsis sp. H20-H5]
MNLPLPSHGWMPEADDHTAPHRPAHWVPPGCHKAVGADGQVLYLAQCGVACYPNYGTDPTRRIARHGLCSDCELHVPCPICTREEDELNRLRLR